MTGRIKKTKRAARRYFRSGSFGDFLSFVGFQTEYLFLRAARLVAAAARAFGGGVVWTLALAGTVLQPILHTVLRDLVGPVAADGPGACQFEDHAAQRARGGFGRPCQRRAGAMCCGAYMCTAASSGEALRI